LSVSASGAQAQGVEQGKPTLTVWAEGALFLTARDTYNIPTLPGLTTPFTAFSPRSGYEGAVGFDFRWAADRAWHFVFDIRYGRSKTASRNSASSSTNIIFSGFTITSILNQTSTQATQREQHLVVDFMAGRDLGIGGSAGQVQFGVRVADLYAAANALRDDRTTTTTTFYSSIVFTSTTATSTYATWKSRFFGAGPRVAIVGSVPIAGFWSFDYGGGIAALIGRRTFDISVASSAGSNYAANFRSTAFVFNADMSMALSYLFKPNLKVSSGVRGDYYNSALTTYNVNTGALQNISRLFWGPFVRLTGSF
jgi:hypothetical protein